jgi:hypothetical protein
VSAGDRTRRGAAPASSTVGQEGGAPSRPRARRESQTAAGLATAPPPI